jgi:hypothetical protein
VDGGLEDESVGVGGGTGGSWVTDRELPVLSTGGEITVRMDADLGVVRAEIVDSEQKIRSWLAIRTRCTKKHEESATETSAQCYTP